MDVVQEQTAKLSAVVATVSDKVAASPVPGYYAAYFGDTPFQTFVIDWLPLFSSVIFPVICLLFVAVGLCGKKEPNAKVGQRILRRINIAIRADVRMMKGSSKNVFKGPTSLKDVETGKKTSPVKGKAEEAAIKKAAASKGGAGGRFY